MLTENVVNGTHEDWKVTGLNPQIASEMCLGTVTTVCCLTAQQLLSSLQEMRVFR